MTLGEVPSGDGIEMKGIVYGGCHFGGLVGTIGSRLGGVEGVREFPGSHFWRTLDGNDARGWGCYQPTGGVHSPEAFGYGFYVGVVDEDCPEWYLAGDSHNIR